MRYITWVCRLTQWVEDLFCSAVYDCKAYHLTSAGIVQHDVNPICNKIIRTRIQKTTTNGEKHIKSTTCCGKNIDNIDQWIILISILTSIPIDQISLRHRKNTQASGGQWLVETPRMLRPERLPMEATENRSSFLWVLVVSFSAANIGKSMEIRCH